MFYKIFMLIIEALAFFAAGMAVTKKRFEETILSLIMGFALLFFLIHFFCTR